MLHQSAFSPSTYGPSQGGQPGVEPASNLTPVANGRRVAQVPGATGPSPESSKAGVKPMSVPSAPAVARPVAAVPTHGVLATSRSFVPPPGHMPHVASSFVPSASRFYSYTSTPGARNSSSFTPSAS